MARFEVEVGGFVTKLYHRKLTVYAINEAEAEAKAIDKFIELQHINGNDCDDATVDSIKKF